MSTTITYTDHTLVSSCMKNTEERATRLNDQLKQYYAKGYHLIGSIQTLPETNSNYSAFYATVAKPVKQKEIL